MGATPIRVRDWFTIFATGAVVALGLLVAAGDAHARTNAQAQTYPRTHSVNPNGTPRIRFPKPRFKFPQYRRSPDAPREYERITSFVSDIVVGEDGRLTVHETIRVYATRNQVRHGIYRTLPAFDRDAHGQRSRLRFEILGVKRDNHDEPYRVEMLSHDWAIRIGDSDVLVTRGPHVYEITYRTNPRIGFFPGHDELYWNVTGSDWRLRIEQATTTVMFPFTARILDHAHYTGPHGSREQHAVFEPRADNIIVFRSTKTLERHEGLTVQVSIAKGAVVEPDAVGRFSGFLHDNKDTAAVMVGLILLMAYFYIAWESVGRDPEGGPVAPLYEPPHGISAAGARYILRMGYDAKAFAATLVSLGVKGVLSVQEQTYLLQRTFTLVRNPFVGTRGASLTHAEAAVASTLFGRGPEIELIRENQPTIARAITVLKHTLADEFDEKYFKTNSAWFSGGIAILALSVLAAALFSDAIGDTIMVFLLSTLAGMIAAQFGVRAARHWWAVYARYGSRIVEFFRAVWWTLGTLPMLAVVIGIMFFQSDAMSPFTIAALAAQGFVACMFYELLKAPTAAGAKLRAEIKGFKMFLDMTEKDRLELEQPVDVTPETFEKYLPYAIALDAENSWGHRFQADIALASTAAMAQDRFANAYSPGWYSGGAFGSANFGSFASSLGDGLGGVVARAAFAGHNFGGGSGGGGFSGGGGGGGGGGGW